MSRLCPLAAGLSLALVACTADEPAEADTCVVLGAEVGLLSRDADGAEADVFTAGDLVEVYAYAINDGDADVELTATGCMFVGHEVSGTKTSMTASPLCTDDPVSWLLPAGEQVEQRVLTLTAGELVGAGPITLVVPMNTDQGGRCELRTGWTVEE